MRHSGLALVLNRSAPRSRNFQNRFAPRSLGQVIDQHRHESRLDVDLAYTSVRDENIGSRIMNELIPILVLLLLIVSVYLRYRSARNIFRTSQRRRRERQAVSKPTPTTKVNEPPDWTSRIHSGQMQPGWEYAVLTGEYLPKIENGCALWLSYYDLDGKQDAYLPDHETWDDFNQLRDELEATDWRDRYYQAGREPRYYFRRPISPNNPPRILGSPRPEPELPDEYSVHRQKPDWIGREYTTLPPELECAEMQIRRHKGNYPDQDLWSYSLKCYDRSGVFRDDGNQLRMTVSLIKQKQASLIKEGWQPVWRGDESENFTYYYERHS